MPRKPGGKYKGKVGRAKGEATIAAELEAKRRKAYENNLAKLQERRNQDLLAAHGMQSAEEDALQMKMARIAQLFGQGKKGLLTKFWKNWKIGLIQTKKEKALDERKTCWRRSCDFCADMDVHTAHRYGEFGNNHMTTCKEWWKSTLGQSHLGDFIDPKAAESDRPHVVNDFRSCGCCGVDTGLPGAGCRCYMRLRDRGFRNPSDVDKENEKKAMNKSTRFKDSGPSSAMSTMSTMASRMMGTGGMSTRSVSSPSFGTPRTPKKSTMTLSVTDNWNQLRYSGSEGGMSVPVYDPSEAFALTPKQIAEEDRRKWSDELSAMAGSPSSRKRSGHVGLPAIKTVFSPIKTLPPPKVPQRDSRGHTMQEAAHWRTGQKTMLDAHMMRMYVIGVQ